MGMFTALFSYSKNIGEKLIFTILTAMLQDLEHPDALPSYLVVAGDHGMHDSGSHGGATLGEILASLLLIESTPHKMSLSG